jgi:transcriptional regulator with PAS, ATPase and Fis domain
MAQQTAVEQLINYMKENFHLTDESLRKFEAAKEMEKEQIEAAWKRGDGHHDKVADRLAKKYYTQTYGK